MSEIPLSSIPRLSEAEESGRTAIAYGLRPNRTMQPPRQRVGQQHVAYVWPWPLPSQHHPVPRRQR